MPEEFIVHGTMGTSNHGGLEIQISEDGEAVKVRDTHTQCVPRWQQVRFSNKGAYIIYYNQTHYLDDFIKTDKYGQD